MPVSDLDIHPPRVNGLPSTAKPRRQARDMIERMRRKGDAEDWRSTNDANCRDTRPNQVTGAHIAHSCRRGHPAR
jgi:hypothetical protein